MPSPVFVTGASGYLGRWVLRALEGSNFTAIHCLSRAARPAEDGGVVRWVQGDLLEGTSYRKALAGCEAVLHLGALTGKGTAREHFRVNLEGTRTLVGECVAAGVSKFLYVSTISAKFPNLRHYHYGQAKQAAERIVRESGLAYVILRPTMIFGAGAPVLQSLGKLAASPVVPVFGDGQAKVQPVFAGDVAEEIRQILERRAFDNRTIEVGGPEVVTIEDLLFQIRRARGGGKTAAVHLPLSPIRWALAAVEPVLLPLLPFTAGQMASFGNDSTAEGAGGGRELAARKGLREMLELAVANGS